MSTPNKEELRQQVVNALKGLKRRQDFTWDLMMNDVTAASDKFVTIRLSLLEKRVSDLAAGTYPTLLESLVGLLVTAIPVAAIVKGLMSHWARSLELGRVAGVLGSKVVGREAHGFVQRMQQINEVRARQQRLLPKVFHPLRKPRIEFVREAAEYNANLTKFAEIYSPEIEDSLRGYIKNSAASAAKPVVDQDQIFNIAAAPKRSEAAMDSSDFLKSVRDWVTRSKHADRVPLEDMQDEADRTDDVKKLEQIKKFVEWEVFSSEHVRENYDREAFQRYIEMCLWCTTWDFRPRFVQATRANPVVGRGMTTPHFEVPPLGDDFWEFACKRYYDPFTGDGTQTYLAVGRSKQLGQVPAGAISAEVGRYIAHQNADPGFYPAERLAFHWGSVIAPALFDLNKEIAQLLERQLGMKNDQSEPTELDVFYQYLLGLRKLGK
jgi:hypothetical protein